MDIKKESISEILSSSVLLKEFLNRAVIVQGNCSSKWGFIRLSEKREVYFDALVVDGSKGCCKTGFTLNFYFTVERADYELFRISYKKSDIAISSKHKYKLDSSFILNTVMSHFEKIDETGVFYAVLAAISHDMDDAENDKDVAIEVVEIS